MPGWKRLTGMATGSKTTKAPRSGSGKGRAKPPFGGKTKAVALPPVASIAAGVQAKRTVTGEGAKVATRLKELTDRIVAATGVKRKDAKPLIEATLKHLGEVLDAGESLILPPLGRLRVSRTKSDESGDILTLKLKRPGAKPEEKPAAQGLAEDVE